MVVLLHWSFDDIFFYFQSSTSNTIVPQDPKKSENDSSQNMAAHLTSTAGNFFKRYTSSGHSATNAQEMSNFNTKVVSYKVYYIQNYIMIYDLHHV